MSDFSVGNTRLDLHLQARNFQQYDFNKTLLFEKFQEIQVVTQASVEMRESRKFSQILEVIFLFLTYFMIIIKILLSWCWLWGTLLTGEAQEGKHMVSVLILF